MGAGILFVMRKILSDWRRGLHFVTRTAYLGVTSGAAQVTAREQVLASSKSQLDATRLGREVGVRTSVDLLNAERKVYESRRDLAQARYQYLMARLQLAAAVGQLDRKVLEGVNQLLPALQSFNAVASATGALPGFVRTAATIAVAVSVIASLYAWWRLRRARRAVSP